MAPDRHVVAGLELLAWGEEAGTPLLFWHGLGPSNPGALTLNEAGPRWAGSGFRVLAPNAPGFGGSPPLAPQEYEVARMAELAVAVLEELGVARAHVVGYSWGGRVGLRVPAERVAALALLDSGYRDVDFGSYDELLARYRREWPSWESWDAYLAEARGHTADTPGTEERLRAAMVERSGRIEPRLTPEVAAGAFSAIGREPDSPWWPRLADRPVLLLVATRPADAQREAAVARFADAVPNAEVRRVPQAGHDVLGDNPDVVVPVVASFLSGNGP